MKQFFEENGKIILIGMVAVLLIAVTVGVKDLVKDDVTGKVEEWKKDVNKGFGKTVGEMDGELTYEINVSNSDPTEGNKENAVDGDPTTFWNGFADYDRDTLYYELEFSDDVEIKYVKYTPRYDNTQKYNCTGRIYGYRIEYKDNNNEWQLAKAGSFPTDDVQNIKPEAIVLDNAIVTRTFRMKATSSYYYEAQFYNTYMNIAELDLFDSNESSIIHKENNLVTITPRCSSEYMGNNENAVKEKAIDGDENTYWATEREFPLRNQYYEISFNKNVKIKEIDFTPRYDNGAKYDCTGRIYGYKIEYKDENEEWKTASEGEFTKERNVKPDIIVLNEAITTDAIRLKSTSTTYHHQTINKNRYMNIGDIDLIDNWGNSLLHP